MKEHSYFKKENKMKKAIYAIDYDEVVIFKERITRFTVRFEFKRKGKKGCTSSSNAWVESYLTLKDGAQTKSS